MTKLLASVTNVAEAEMALRAEVDFIDLKNPTEGALGALPLSIVSEIVTFVDERKQVSATVGDLPMNPEILFQAVEAMLSTGVDIVKVGFFGHEAHRACATSLQPLICLGKKVIAVMFADQNPDFGLLPDLATAGFFGVMLDTADKASGSLTSHLTIAELEAFVTSAARLKLFSGLAGSLHVKDIASLQSLKVDYLGFRSALCVDTDRKEQIDETRLCEVKTMLRNCNNTPVELVA